MKSKSDKIKFIIIILELIVLIGLSSYRIYEFVDKSKEEIKENETNNDDNKEEEKDNTSTEEKTKGKIKVLVYQINIRKEANETSEDIGDVLVDEIYDVLEIIDSNNYTWYKINKNGVIGYVANQKGTNWVDYSENGEFEILKGYECVSDDCKIHDTTDSVALVYENNKYFIYDYKTRQKQYLNINEENRICSMALAKYENKVYGVSCSSGGYGGAFYYSLGQNKMLYDRNIILSNNNSYQDASIDIETDLPFIRVMKHWNTEKKRPVTGGSLYYDNHQMEVFDIRNEKVILTANDVVNLREEKIGNIEYSISLYNGTIYDDDYKEIVKFNPYKGIGCGGPVSWIGSGCSQFNYQINTNNTLTVINNNNYIIYDKNMEEIYKSDEYEQIYLIEDYVITIKDVKMYIFDLSGKIVKEFKLSNEDSKIITGVLHDKDNIETFKIAIGDNYYYYIPSTGESGIKGLVVNGME